MKNTRYSIQTNQRLQCEAGCENNRLRSGCECSCCCCCCSAAWLLLCRCCCVCSTLYGSHAKAIDATGARCAVCAWGVLCDVHVSLQSPQHGDYIFFVDRSSLQQKKTAHRPPASACCGGRQRTRRCNRCCICTLPTLRCMTLLTFAAASRWHGLATGASLS